MRNSVTLKTIAEYNFTAMVFSPGPGVPSQAGIMPALIHNYHTKIPLLGICLGHQGIGEYFGATLARAQKPMHGKLSEIIHDNDPIFNGIPDKIKVVRYHSLLLKNMPPSLQIISQTAENEVMIFKHRTHPCYGIQFHPEAYLTEFGIDLLRNWVNLYQLSG